MSESIFSSGADVDKGDFTITGNIADPVQGRVYPGTIAVSRGRIKEITAAGKAGSTFLLPGFVDAHVHVESLMLVPSEFARLAVRHGTVAALCDPHEIANVLGPAGVRFMIENGRSTPFKFTFGAPSCVPATPFETSGARIGPDGIREMLSWPEIGFLAEMMNFPGVLQNDADVMAKIEAARALGKPIDGHAPGLTGPDLQRYVAAGISTDHECLSLAEAREKIRLGMKIIIREGSAARGLDMLLPLLDEFPELCMFATDDMKPADLVRDHIRLLVQRAVAAGLDFMKVLRAATLNPARHYGLEIGLLQKGDPADFIEIDDPADLNVLRTFINGRLVAKDGETTIAHVKTHAPNCFKAMTIGSDDLRLQDHNLPVRVITAEDGQICTGSLQAHCRIADGCLVSDPARDILKIVVLDRYTGRPPALGFVRGFGLTRGAIASSVAHDSHNVIAVGADDTELARALNLVGQHKGGLAVAAPDLEEILPLPVAGIMTHADGFRTAAQYARLDRLAKDLGSGLTAPFLTLSFMALPVIPELKLTDHGLFDLNCFRHVDLYVR
jgi:adenine deaminase